MKLADTKFYEMCIDEMFSKYGRKPEAKDRESVAQVFEEQGGTWESLAVAETEAWALLRKVCKTFIKEENDEK